MSSDDLLRRAARDLRERSDGDAGAGARTRERVLALTAKRKRRRKSWTLVTVMLGSLLMMSSVWAAATGRLPRLWHALVPHQAEPPIAGSQAVPRTPPVAPSPPLASAPEPRPAPATTTVAQPAKRSVPARPSPPAPTDPEEQLFKSAYRDQFVRHDAQAALDGWNAYLGAAPQGRFALEAAYDRALCLVRLGRRAEAISALRPFVDGTHGDYHRRDATRLSAALGEAAP
jgi:hypothetical protein